MGQASIVDVLRGRGQLYRRCRPDVALPGRGQRVGKCGQRCELMVVFGDTAPHPLRNFLLELLYDAYCSSGTTYSAASRRLLSRSG